MHWSIFKVFACENKGIFIQPWRALDYFEGHLQKNNSPHPCKEPFIIYNMSYMRQALRDTACLQCLAQEIIVIVLQTVSVFNNKYPKADIQEEEDLLHIQSARISFISPVSLRVV